jgi:hypothetical protein
MGQRSISQMLVWYLQINELGYHSWQTNKIGGRMTKIVAAIVAVLAIVVSFVLIFAATQPPTFRIERSVAIKASPDKIYPIVADFRRWADWSPAAGPFPTSSPRASVARGEAVLSTLLC